MGRKVTQDEVERWLDLKGKGYTDRAIGEKFNRDEKTIARYLKPHLQAKEKGSPYLDSELETLKRAKEKHQILAELDKLRLENQRIPERLEAFEGELKKLGITLKAFGEDLERLRLQLKSQPDFSKVKCPKCGDYMAVDAMCVSCNHKYCFGLWPGGE